MCFPEFKDYTFFDNRQILKGNKTISEEERARLYNRFWQYIFICFRYFIFQAPNTVFLQEIFMQKMLFYYISWHLTHFYAFLLNKYLIANFVNYLSIFFLTPAEIYSIEKKYLCSYSENIFFFWNKLVLFSLKFFVKSVIFWLLTRSV